MRALRRSARLARVASCGVLMLGLAASAVAGAGAAQARTTIKRPFFQSAAVSWGVNDTGQLGNGSSVNSALYGGVSGLGSGVTQVAAGGDFALAVKSDGTVWAWGGNEYGQLGDGSLDTSSVPVQVPGLSGVTQVTAGHDTGYALRSDGTVWAWGISQDGQLGTAVTGTSSPVPVQVAGLTGITQIAAGAYFSLALRSDGTVWAWGDNFNGELGDGMIGTSTDSRVPVQVSGLSRVTMIAAGGDNGMAVRTRGLYTTLTSVMVWGLNPYGALGVPGQGISHVLTPVAVSGIGTGSVTGISMGLGDTAMVLYSDGSVWEWDNGGFGQIPGGSGEVFTPIETMAPGSGITQISAGDEHELALRSDGTVLAWGDNNDGQLGDGTAGGESGPVQVPGLTNATQIAAGSNYSLAIHQVPASIFLP
jgi:alpha-tubulin suppressor-like RCC1 family protein